MPWTSTAFRLSENKIKDRSLQRLLLMYAQEPLQAAVF
jgi:hypothetical protein